MVCVAGDGCFLMSAQELATAALHELAIVVIVVSNGSYGTIRSHQRRRFPGREIGTAIRNPDFVAFARSFGAEGVRVTSTGDFAPALEREPFQQLVQRLAAGVLEHQHALPRSRTNASGRTAHAPSSSSFNPYS